MSTAECALESVTVLLLLLLVVKAMLVVVVAVGSDGCNVTASDNEL